MKRSMRDPAAPRVDECVARATGPDHGFTLIEVAVAVVILAGALVAAMASYGSELRTLSRARDVNVAIELAEDRLAAIRLFARDRLPSLPDSLEDGAFPPPFDRMRWDAEAHALAGSQLAEVRVTVAWSTGAHEISTVMPIVTTGPR